MGDKSTAAQLLQRFSYLTSIFTAFKFEAHASHRLAQLFPSFIRGREGSPLDAAFAVVHECADKDTQDRLAEFFDFGLQPLPLVERAHKLHDIVGERTEKFLIGLDFKRADVHWDQHSGRPRWVWTIKLSQKQRKQCAAVIIGFSSHPGWWALYPMEKVSDKIDSVGRIFWTQSGRSGLRSTVPVELWPYMVDPSCQKRAVQDMMDYFLGRKLIWENPWTGVDYRCIERPAFCAVDILHAADQVGWRLITWLKNAFKEYSSAYIIEDTRYSPLTCDFKIVNTNDMKEQYLVELKSSQCCELQAAPGGDQFIIRHRQYHPLNYAQRRQPIFSPNSGRWAAILTVPEHWRPDRSSLPTRLLFIPHRDIPRSWKGSTEEWLSWPNPMTMQQLRQRYLLDVDEASPQAVVMKIDSWLKDHTFSSRFSADDLLAAHNSPANTAINDEIAEIAGRITIDDDVIPTSTTSLDYDDGLKARSCADVEYVAHFARHQEEQSRDFLMQCRRRRQGLIFSISSSFACKDFIYRDHRWTDSDCRHYDRYITSPRKLWQFPLDRKIMNLNFVPLPWQDGAEHPALLNLVNAKLIGSPEHRPSLVVFAACGLRSKSKTLGIRFLVPSTSIQVSDQHLQAGKGVVIKLDHVLDSYRVENMDHLFRGIQSFFDDGQKVSVGFKDVRIDHEQFVYRVADVYPTLLREPPEISRGLGQTDATSKKVHS